MLGLSLEAKILISLLAALIIAWIIALGIGEQRKAVWFKKRTKFSIFGKRGAFGDVLHFGYPRTIEGGIVTVVMVSLMGIASYLIVTFL